jgi:hypothetical protein
MFKTDFTKMHHFYDTMCTDCGDFNYAKRFQTANVKGQVAVITGSRLKIGYHITLMLLLVEQRLSPRFRWILHCVLGRT